MALGDLEENKIPNDLFKDIKYYLVGPVDDKVVKLLNDGGGKRDNYLSEMVSHVIADNTDQDEYCEAKELFDLPVVTSMWVILSAKCKKQLPMERFSPEGLVFSGIVVCPARLEPADQKAVWGMVVYNGGKCVGNLGRDVTHLITTDLDSIKCSKLAIKESVKIVSPDWIVESLNEGHRLDEELFHPNLIYIPPPTPPPVPVMPQESLGTSLVTTVESSVAKTSLDPFHFTGGEEPGTDLLHPDPYTAKEALARMVNHRLQASGKSPETRSPVPLFPTIPQTDSIIHRPLRNICNGVDKSLPLSAPLVIPPPRFSTNKMPSRVNWPLGFHQSKPSISVTTDPLLMKQTYYGHDANDKIPTEMCLLGCIFYIAEYQKILSSEVISTWKTVIEQHGGQVDPAYSNRVTHLLCPHQQNDVFHLALKDQRRVVTAYWLNDCIFKKRMSPPWQALHLPVIYGEHKPCFTQIIALSNYMDDERHRIKQMLKAIGARYTAYLAYSNSVLISKRPEGQKYIKAKEWSIPVVNVAWLSDLVLGYLDALRLPVNQKYLELGHQDEFSIDVSRVSHLMVGWRNPLKVTKEALRKFVPSPKMKNKKTTLQTDLLSAKKRAEDDNEFAAKRQRLDFETMGVPMTCSLISCPVVTFTGYRGNILTSLKETVLELGGRVSEQPLECTHLVAKSLLRTVKLFVAVNVVSWIVTKEWLEDSRCCHQFIDERRYILKDLEVEAEIKADLSESHHRARQKPLFQGLIFYITPSVIPSPIELKPIIESAGGKVVGKFPSAKKILSEATEKGFTSHVIITCSNDIQLCRTHISKNISVHTVEYVLTGVLRQEIDSESFRFPIS